MTIGRIYTLFLLSQAALIPLFLISLLAAPPRSSTKFAVVLHRLLLAASLALPALLSVLSTGRAAGQEPGGIAPAAIHRSEGAAGSSGPPPIAAYSPGRARIHAPGQAVSLSFLSASVLGGMWFAARYIRQRVLERRICASAVVRRKIGRLSIIVSDRVPAAFSSGFITPRIFLPAGHLNDRTGRSFILLHEGCHVRRAHYAALIVEDLLRSLFWFDPLLHMFAASGRLLREIACDSAACRADRDGYSKFLLTAARNLADAHPVSPLIEKHSLARRMEALKGAGRTHMAMKPLVVIMTAACAALTWLAVGIAPAHAQGSTPPGSAAPQELGSYTQSSTGKTINKWSFDGTFPGLKALKSFSYNGFQISAYSQMSRDAFLGDFGTILTEINRRLPAIGELYIKFWKENQKLYGEMSVLFSMEKDGTIDGVGTRGDIPGQEAFSEAVRQSIREWGKTGPVLSGSYQVILPLDFHPLGTNWGLTPQVDTAQIPWNFLQPEWWDSLAKSDAFTQPGTGGSR